MQFSRFLFFVLLAPHVVSARTLHVDAQKGSDKNDGLSTKTAFATIQRAANLVEPGDEVIVRPGVYFERVKLTRLGTAEKPIVFRAETIEKNSVILSGADRKIRSGVRWTCVDEKLGIYSTPYTGASPIRLLYSGTDLYPYMLLESLQAFITDFKNDWPGPKHGYFHDTKAGVLYVRLNASGRCGSIDPNKHIIALAKNNANGFSIDGEQPAYLTLDGFTFETPGNTAVYAGPGQVTVRNCWFVGCPYGVRGYKKNPETPARRTDNVTIEYCDYSDSSSFADADELIRDPALVEKFPRDRVLYWHRKSAGLHGLPAGRLNYETGFTVSMGKGWILRRNYFHDTFEALCNDGMNSAEDVTITENLFARMCDNAIETEDHSRNVRIFRNVFLNIFEPFSWQPLSGPPWAGPIYFYQNLVITTPDHGAAWGRAIPNQAHGVFKMGISLKNWRDGRNADVPKSPLEAPAPGLLFYNNTIYFPGGRLITMLGDRKVPIANVRFAYNLIATDRLLAAEPENELESGIFRFDHNLVAPASNGLPGAGPIAAGEEGRTFSSVAAFGWKNIAAQDFSLTAESPALNAGGKMDGMGESLTAAGAFQGNDAWYPLHVGPNGATVFPAP